VLKNTNQVTYKCVRCGNGWETPASDAAECNIQLCIECDSMVGLSHDSWLDLLKVTPSGVGLWQTLKKKKKLKKT
jgi:DNA-directed RNA polymerase subunit RPC12/RpoP